MLILTFNLYPIKNARLPELLLRTQYYYVIQAMAGQVLILCVTMPVSLFLRISFTVPSGIVSSFTR